MIFCQICRCITYITSFSLSPLSFILSAFLDSLFRLIFFSLSTYTCMCICDKSSWTCRRFYYFFPLFHIYSLLSTRLKYYSRMHFYALTFHHFIFSSFRASVHWVHSQCMTFWQILNLQALVEKCRRTDFLLSFLYEFFSLIRRLNGLEKNI